MPYISSAARQRLVSEYRIGTEGVLSPGDVAYIIADTIDTYLGSTYRYEDLATMKGVLSTVAADFERSIVAPYEADKKKENGTAWLLSEPVIDWSGGS